MGVESVSVWKITDVPGEALYTNNLRATYDEVRRQLATLQPTEMLRLTGANGETLTYTADEAEDLLDQMEEHL